MPMAYGLTRAGLATMLRVPYFVTEKSDGERMYGVVCKGWKGLTGLYKVDRKGHVSQLPDETGARYADILCPKEGQPPILFDAELIKATSSVFMFDLMALPHVEEDAASLRLDHRLRLLAQHVRLPFKVAAAAAGAGDLPLQLLSKMFVPTREIKDITSCMEGDLYKRTGYPPTVNDGLIFTPIHASFRELFRNGVVKKWKPAKHLTVDFLVGDDAHSLISCGNARVHIPVARLSAPFTPSKVVEARYRTSTSQWSVVRERPDKQYPNHISVAWNTMELLAENLCMEEVEYRCQQEHVAARKKART